MIPLTIESTMNRVEDNSTLVCVMDVKASEHQIRQAVRRLSDIDVANVDTLIKPHGEKKAYIQPSPDSNALDVAHKIGII